MVLGVTEMDIVGDVNLDGTVDVLDIITVVNIILDEFEWSLNSLLYF